MIRIRMKNGRWRDAPVDSVAFGNWAAHLAALPDSMDATPGNGWRVTYLPTGTAVANFADDMTREDACALARLLADRVPQIPTESSGSYVYGAAEYRYVVEAVIGESLGGTP